MTTGFTTPPSNPLYLYARAVSPGTDFVPVPLAVGQPAASAAAAPQNQITAVPYSPWNAWTSTVIRTNVTTLDAAGHIRVGIYADRGNGLGPGLLIAGSSSGSVGGVGVFDQLAGATFAPGSLYWIAFNCDTAVARFTTYPTAQLIPFLGFAGAFATMQHCLQRGFAYAAFPADESAQVYAASGNNIPAMGLR